MTLKTREQFVKIVSVVITVSVSLDPLKYLVFVLGGLS